jgi:hypothetical protein
VIWRSGDPVIGKQRRSGENLPAKRRNSRLSAQGEATVLVFISGLIMF